MTLANNDYKNITMFQKNSLNAFIELTSKNITISNQTFF